MFANALFSPIINLNSNLIPNKIIIKGPPKSHNKIVLSYTKLQESYEHKNINAGFENATNNFYM